MSDSARRRSTFGRRAAAVAGALCATLSLYAQQPTARPFVAQPGGAFEIIHGEALFMPTGVAVASDGDVWVVDGVNDRLVRFNPFGEPVEIATQVGEERLAQPVTAHFDDAGMLWIADTGNQRLLVRKPDGALARTVTIADDAQLGPIDLTDFVLTPDASALWLVDNDHHRLLRLTLETGRVEVVGRRGESLGEFNYPFMLARGAHGDLLLTDVINGRVQVLDASGRPARSVGTYGVALGQFYRPKGVTLDAAGRIWVSDGTLNVVQIFTPDGRLIDVLRDEGGNPLRFELPMDLAFDADGNLYVVETLAHRVRKVLIRHDPNAPPATAAPQRRAAAVIPQPRSCTICHLEWMTPLAQGQSTELIDPPPNPADWPYVSRSELCLGCHDASVGDSRRRVWVEHGHQIGIAPPTSMSVPAELPLTNGQIRCRTCHSAHTLPEERTTFEEIVFLRVKREPSELCMGCHAGYAGGGDDGMHPLGTMAIDLPPQSARHTPAERLREISCMACHSGHGAELGTLLVADVRRNTLCLSCHAELDPQVFGDDRRTAHGGLPTLDERQAATAATFETQLGEDGALACVTCHVSHDAPVKASLLAFDRAARDVCAECHPAQQAVVSSAHDLRTNHPDATNVRGVTAVAGGACSGCHTAHQFARAVAPSKLDPQGQCVNCHAADRLAADATLGTINHPETDCAACHEPHAGDQAHFLKDQPFTLCSECHEDQQQLVGGPHDPATRAEFWPAEARQTEDACLACHQPHGDEQRGLFRVAWEPEFHGPDAACLACHPQAVTGADSRIAIQHPRTAHGLEIDHALPLVTAEDGTQQLNCNTCHNPHRGPEAGAHLLRVGVGTEPEQVCLVCHVERANIHTIGHAIEPLRAAGFEVDACQPCHVAHGPSSQMEATLMWPTKLNDFEGYDEVPVANRHCVSCHRDDGPVAPPAIATHPEAQMFNPIQPGEPAYVPLFNAAGEVDPQGTIGCRTCHLTHGRSEPAPVSATLAAQGGRELRARQWHVRSFIGQNVCTTCHGADALRRFMYFHDPARRGGPIEGG